VETGLAKLGYTYVNIDDCWQTLERNADGTVSADPVRFPSGMKALSDYVHSKGLKLGIYSSAGFKTCQRYPAGLGMEDIDAATYASWGIDYLKYDNCYQDHGSPRDRFAAMARALESTGREIFYSLCEWGRANPATWAGAFANSWRISPDIKAGWTSIITRAEIAASLWRYAGPGPDRGWNDPDMLEVGNGNVTSTEAQTHFSLWAMLKAPMILGNDIRTLVAAQSAAKEAQSAVLDIVTNEEVLAVNQDPRYAPARIVYSDVSKPGDRVINTQCVRSAAVHTTSTTTVTAVASGNHYFQLTDTPMSQAWVFDAVTSTIRSLATQRCLTEDTSSATEEVQEDGRRGERVYEVRTTECSASPTRWLLQGKEGGMIVSQGTGHCLEVNTNELLPVFDGKHLQTSTCLVVPLPSNGTTGGGVNNHGAYDVREHQSWTLRPALSPVLRSNSNTNNAATTTEEGYVLYNLYGRQCLTVDSDAYPGKTQEIWLSPLLPSPSPTTTTDYNNHNNHNNNNKEDDSTGKVVILAINKGHMITKFVITFSMLQLPSSSSSSSSSSTAYQVRDLWSHTDLSHHFTVNNTLDFVLESHASRMFSLTPIITPAQH